MCGIAGILQDPRDGLNDLSTDVEQMLASLRHRGPDGSGIWIDDRRTVGLGHRRLAIIELSHQGAQPMVSPDGSKVLTYNGEIYNYVELRKALEGPAWRFRGTSDTEVLLAALARWGVEEALD